LDFVAPKRTADRAAVGGTIAPRIPTPAASDGDADGAGGEEDGAGAGIWTASETRKTWPANRVGGTLQ